MPINTPQLNIYNSTANPLIVLGCLLFVGGFVLEIFVDSDIGGLLVKGLGLIVFSLGVIFHFTN
jgi:hypothetical protein